MIDALLASVCYHPSSFVYREDDQEDDTLISSTVIGRDEMLINMSYDFDHFVHETFEVLPPLGVTFPSGSRSVFSYFVDMQVCEL